MAQQTQINGNRYSFVDMTVTMAGIDQPRAFLSINYDATKEPGKVMANSIVPVGYTAGHAEGSGSFQMLDAELDDFFSDLTNDGDLNAMDVDFDIIVNFSANGTDVRTDELRGCRITKVTKANQQGTEASSTTCDISIRRIKRNGINLFGEAQG